MEPFTIDELSTVRESRIVVIGVGNSGSNIINYMMDQKLSGIELIIANTNKNDGYEDLRSTLKGADIIFVITGLGGATGTFAASTIAKIAKEAGALTIGVVSKPFCFEDAKCHGVAEEGLRRLKMEADSVVVISNSCKFHSHVSSHFTFMFPPVSQTCFHLFHSKFPLGNSA